MEHDHTAEAGNQLAEQLRRMSELLEHCPTPHLVLDPSGTLHMVNRAAAALLADTEDGARMTGRRLHMFLADADRSVLRDHLRRCTRTPGVSTAEVHLRDGTFVGLSSRYVANGWEVIQTTVVDLRERLRAENVARRAHAAERAARAETEARDKFIAALSHELRTPLTPVLAAVTALTGDPAVPSSLRRMYEMIRRNVETETRLIDDLLDLTSIARGKIRLDRRPLDVHDLVRDAVEMIRGEMQAKEIDVGLFLDAADHVIEGDSLRLKQVFWNLLRNAVRFTAAHGRIEVRSWNDKALKPHRIAIEVSDDGEGFAPGDGARLFEPFEQGEGVPARNGGLGLGLAISKGLVELLDGRIAATSAGRGHGARFVVDLSVTAAAATSHAEGGGDLPPPERQPETRAGRGTQGGLLLVEDHPDTAATLGKLLTDAGFAVQTASSVATALAADLARVDILISDIGLPDGSGLDLMRALRPGDVKGISLSGYGTEKDIRASEEAGFALHLTKPVDFWRLLEAIHSLAPAVGRGAARPR